MFNDNTWTNNSTFTFIDLSMAIRKSYAFLLKPNVRSNFFVNVGGGYRFDDGDAWYSRLWSVESGFRHYGSGVSAGGTVTGDHTYGKILNGTLHPRHVTPSTYEATDHLQGGYMRVSKGVDVGYGLVPYVSAGVEILYHDLNFWTRSTHGRLSSGGFTGGLAGPTVGGGVRYALWRGVNARFGAEAHWLLTESGHPISSHWLTVGGGIEVPLTWLNAVRGSPSALVRRRRRSTA